MTIQELYKWAIKNDVEDYDLAVYNDNGDIYIERNDLGIDTAMEEVFIK